MKDITYAFVVESLIYTQTCTHPDISFVIRMLGRFQTNLGWDHWVTAKKVMQYLQGTKVYILTCKHTENLKVIGYSNSNSTRCLDSRKSTSRYVFLLASEVVLWKSLKQSLCFLHYGSRICGML